MLHSICRAVRFGDRQRQGITFSTAFRYRDFRLHTILQLFGIYAICRFRNGHYRCCIHRTISVAVTRNLTVDRKLHFIPSFSRVTALSQADTHTVLTVNNSTLRNIHGYLTGSNLISGDVMCHVFGTLIRMSHCQCNDRTFHCSCRQHDFCL